MARPGPPHRLDTHNSACPTQLADFDDRQFWQHELGTRSKSWRTETYAGNSFVLILDRAEGKPNIQYCNDAEIRRRLDPKRPQPRVRIILLEPTPVKRFLHKLEKQHAEVLVANELVSENADELANIWPMNPDAPKGLESQSQLNISETSLRQILERYNIAPATASHIRGQEQIFGYRTSSEKNGNVEAFEFWYAIRARAYFRELREEADLKITVVTHYDVTTGNTTVLLKYRSFNDLPFLLQSQLTAALRSLVLQPATDELAGDPFALCMFHFSMAVQYYRRGARDPRDTIRKQEKMAHEDPDKVDLRMVHLLLGSLDQDRIQLNCMLELICRLRKLHDKFYRRVKKISNPEERGWLYARVEEDFDRFENQVKYFRNSVQDVAARAQRLLDLLFNLSARRSSRSGAKMAEHAMYESASMTTISVVTMLFLPGSFVAGILGTNLFTGPSQQPTGTVETSNTLIADEWEKGLHVSEEWWLLLAIVGPMTMLTFTGWYVWKIQLRRKIRHKVENFV